VRKIFGRELVKYAELDKNLFLIVGDIGYGIFDDFRSRFPERFINMGICEQSMVGVAAGMSLEGLNPWVYTITPFLIERPFEQVKLDIAQQFANVKLVGYADYPTLGPTHSEVDGKKLMGLLPEIQSHFPSTENEVVNSIATSYKNAGPHFISLKALSI